MNVVLENNVIQLKDRNQKMYIYIENDNMYFISDDTNGLTVKPNDKLWPIINVLFIELRNHENSKIVKKYQDYLVRIESEENYSKLVFAKVFEDFVFSTVSPKDKIVKINIKTNEIGKILLKFYNNLEMYSKGIHQISMDEYVYTLTKKNILFSEV